MADKLTAATVREALTRRFMAPEWALLFEVRESTGTGASRSADAMAMSLWPSRGLELLGMEIKVTRHDWQRERKNPTKAEAIAAYCDRWCLVTVPGVVQDASEIPPAWGWLELVDGRIKELKPATRTEAQPVDGSFLAALLRRASLTDEGSVAAIVERKDKERQANFDARVEAALQHRTRHHKEMLEPVTAFEEVTGIKLNDREGWTYWGDGIELGKAVDIVRKTGIADSYGGLHHAVKTLREGAEKIEKVIADLSVPAPAETDALRQHISKGRRK